MLIIDSATEQVLDSVDQELGSIETREIPVILTWHETEPAYYEEEITTFPNGGINILPVLINEAQGFWEVTMENGKPFPYPYEPPEGLPTDSQLSDIVTVNYYTPYTEKELAERKEKLEAARKRSALINALPETQASTDEAICQLYEDLLEQQEITASQDAAICEMYEMLLGE